MPRDAKNVAAGLAGKGFILRDGDHHFYSLVVGGKKTGIFTKVSHGEREIHDGLLAQMAKQTKLVKKDFLDLVDCPMSAADYLKKLRDGGHLPQEDGMAMPDGSKPLTKPAG
jgi:predicted RNA binding protein YcfA (HicA-like mRNA interferase family)